MAETGEGPDRIRGLPSLLLRAVDSGIPASLGAAEPFRRARIILGAGLVLLLVGVLALAFFFWALPLQLAAPFGAGVGVGLLFVLSVPTVFRRWGALDLGANLVVAGFFLSVFAGIAVAGGIRAPALHWLALPPLLALSMGVRSSAWGWSALALVSLALFTGLDATGTELPDPFDLALLQGPMLWLMRLFDVGLWLGILFSVALVYEANQRKQNQALEEKNALLESEIEQRGRAEERTQFLAYYDELTSLPNRRLFEHHLAQAMEQAPRIDRKVAVLFVDLDGFKQVNDTYGHALGDGVLQQVAQRLRSCVRMSDVTARTGSSDPRVVSRLGGDEFTVLLTCVRDHREAGLVAQRILSCLEAPFPLGDNEVYISASIGIAVFPSAGEGLSDLLRSADLAMYHAKDRGKNTFQFFEESMNWGIVRHSALAADLRKGLERGEFTLNFQPMVDAENLRVVALEALARWDHPEQGAISAREFIEVAEKSGLIVPLGDWIFREACRQYASWRDDGLDPPRLAINVSGPQLRRGTFLGTALATLRELGIDPSRLELEVTEGAMLVDEDEASRCLAELKDLGVRVALDDFGTGYSSLSYVKRFPVDSLKIDRSFVHDIEANPEAQAISTAIIAMAHRLGLEVVAEGVETRAQEEFLRQHGCDQLQGYLYGRPVDADETARLLREVWRRKA